MITLHRYQNSPVLNVIKWGRDWTLHYKPILYRFAAFRLEDEKGNEQMFEIIVPRQERFTIEVWQPLFAHHVRFRKDNEELDFEEYRSSERVPVQRPGVRHLRQVLDADASACVDAVRKVVAFYRQIRDALIGMNPAWGDVLTEEKEALVETSAKRFYHSMAMLFEAAQPAKDLYGYMDMKKFNPSLIPFIERLTFLHSSDTGPLPDLDILTISPENALPFFMDKGEFLPLTAFHTVVKLLQSPPEREAVSRHSLVMTIPPHLRERLRIKHVHHEASWRIGKSSESVYFSRLMGVGMLDENNPGVFVLEACHRDEGAEIIVRVGASFFVAPLLTLFHPRLRVEGNDWREAVLFRDTIQMPSRSTR